MNTNIRRLGTFFLIAFAIILADVTYWQVIDASSIQARADNPRLRLQAESVRRGSIYDRNGSLLAGRTMDAQGFVHRFYTDPSLSQVIGYDSPVYGKSELEKSYDDFLAGRVVGSSWRAAIRLFEHKPVYGDDLMLTIDDRLQKQVATFLPDSPSAAVVADPRTGEILAMASKPGFDNNQVSDSTYWRSLLTNTGDPLINRPVNGYYPPGSTFKIVTLAMALDTGTMSLNTFFSGQAATGPLTVDGHVYPASINNLGDCGYSSVNLTQALMCSDNIVFAQVGLAVGTSHFLDYTKRFGLDQPTPFDIPVSTSHVLSRGESLSRVALASTSFGQGSLRLTPLQMLMAAEAPANGGKILRPILVKRVLSQDGAQVQINSSSTLYQPISAQTADQVRSAMTQVVEGQGGSGFQARIPGIQVAGKTGTAETGDGKPPHAWFICFAPADHPRVAAAVMVEHGGQGFSVAAPIARRILAAALPLVH